MEKLEKLCIWYSEKFDDGWGWLLPYGQPEEHCATYGLVELHGETPDQAVMLNREYKASGEEWNYFLDCQRIKSDYLDEYTLASLCRTTVAYDTVTDEIIALDGLEIVRAFRWWDGHNMVWESLSEDDGMTEEVIEVLPDPVNIDRWDGQNMATWGMGHNGYIYRTPDPDKFVLVCRTRWEGGKDEAAVMTAAELRDWAKDYREEEVNSLLNLKEED